MSLRPLPIVVDTPSSNPGLGFPVYAEALAAAVLGGTPPQFTIGIYGAWGTGKSSLLHAIRTVLDSDPACIPVPFDAWRYEREPHIMLPLLHRVTSAVEATAATELVWSDVGARLREVLKAVAMSLEVSFGPLKVGANTDTLQGDSTLSRLDVAFARPFEQLRSLGAALHDRRLVVLVDDLDRCSPDNIVALLEAINLVMDVHGIIFVLALDYDVLVSAIAMKYPHVARPDAFVEKMVQVAFRVPPLDISHRDALQTLIPSWSDIRIELGAEAASEVWGMAVSALRGNPRQVKRLVNSLLLLSRMANEREVDLDRIWLARLLALQLMWPMLYSQLQIAVHSGDDAPFASLSGSPDLEADPEFQRFRRQALATEPDTGVLREILMMTDALSPMRVGRSPVTLSPEAEEMARKEKVSYQEIRAILEDPREARVVGDLRVFAGGVGFQAILCAVDSTGTVVSVSREARGVRRERVPLWEGQPLTTLIAAIEAEMQNVQLDEVEELRHPADVADIVKKLQAAKDALLAGKPAAEATAEIREHLWLP